MYIYLYIYILKIYICNIYIYIYIYIYGCSEVHLRPNIFYVILHPVFLM